MQRRVLLTEAKTLQTLRRERTKDPGAAFTVEVAILRTNAELECVEAAEARAGQRLIDLPEQAEHMEAREFKGLEHTNLGLLAEGRRLRGRRA